MLSPPDSAEFIVKNSKHIKINENGIHNLKEAVIQGMIDKTIRVENFAQNDHHPHKDNVWAPEWIFVVDTLNFCFWTIGHDAKWMVEGKTGYFALCASINRAMKEGIDILNPAYYTKMRLEQLAHIFRSDDGITQIPLLEDRLMCLKEVGNILLEKFDGKFRKCVEASSQSAQKLLRLIVEEFPCYRDEAEYAGKKVSFYKRAQILVGDLWACYRGQGLGKFEDINSITMFADYRVPQVLVHFGSLEYSEHLLQTLKNGVILKSGDEREVEIRGASIFIVEKLKERIIEEINTKQCKISPEDVNSILLDHFLWDYRRRFAKELEYIPFHKVISIFY